MSREELEKMKADDLAKICKEKGIVYYRGKTRLRREEMIGKISEAQSKSDSNQEPLPVVRENIDTVAEEKKAEGIYQREGVSKYLEEIKAGTLVAFKERPDKLNTAAVQNASFKRKQLKVVTSYGKEFIISFDDVVWVRTTKGWPRFVMDVLKQQSRARKRGKMHVLARETAE